MNAPPEHFSEHKKFREAKLLQPENILKQKTGSGGIDPALIEKGQEAINNNTIHFKPIGLTLIKKISASVENLAANKIAAEEGLEAIIQPAMQLKAEGTMFKYPSISEAGNILVNFLETVPVPDAKVIEVVKAHIQVFEALLQHEIKEADSAACQNMCQALIDACTRYHKQIGLTQPL